MKSRQDTLYEPRIFPNATPEAIEEVVNFQSVTKSVTEESTKGSIVCPSCGTTINFKERIEWFGPSFFACTGCERILHMNIIAQALRDLGYVR
jgi:hypothetical protein